MSRGTSYRSRVYTERPDYADLPSGEKFMAILGIIATRLKQHPKAICSYSGGSDSDILIDLIEKARHLLGAPPVKYVFFNTGLEMAATKRHVKEVAEKYGVEIVECRPKKNIVMATREYGVPFMSKHFSQAIETMQKSRTPFDIKEIYDKSEDKSKIFTELCNCYPHAKQGIAWICSCDCKGREAQNQLSISSAPFLYDFMQKNPIGFKVSAKCCAKCKKEVAHRIQKDYDIIITGERKAEGGIRAVPHKKINDESTECFYEQRDGKHRFRPLYYVSDKDKAWYKERWGLTYSDAYEVYGLKRTGCCGCPINARAVEDLERIRPYEPNVAKAAWAIFGDSYRYRQEYNAFKEHMKNTTDGQLTFDDIK